MIRWQRSRDSRMVRIGKVTGIGVLALIVAVLSWLALTQNRAASPAATKPPASASPQPTAPEATTEPTPETTPTPTEAAPPAAVAPTRIVTALTTGTLLRTTIGACEGAAPTPEYSTDGGATWQASALTEASPSAILRLIPGDIGQAIILDGECAPSGMWSFSEGVDWAETADFVGSSWRFDATQPDRIFTSAGTESTLPCPALAVSFWDTTAIALCGDATVVTTTDGAASWSAPTPAPGALTVAASPDGFTVLLTGGEDCAGVQVAPLADGALGAGGACLDAQFAPGEVAMSGDGDGAVTVWAGETYARSQDGGATWG